MVGASVGEAVATAAGVDQADWSGTNRSAELIELLEARERLDALIHRTVGAWDRDQCWAADDALSAVSWLVHRVPMTSTDAAILVRTARHLAQHDATAKALDTGDISAAHT